MKRLFLCACFIASALLLRGDDAPTFDLFAGWGWSPFPYYSGYPCRYRYDPYWRAYPSVGLGVPLSRREALYPCDYYGYAPFWGYETGVRINLSDKRHASALSEGLLQPLPGAAPTEPRDPKRELQWRTDLETLYGTGNWARQAAPTNAPAAAQGN
jgi:hypothetical protein